MKRIVFMLALLTLPAAAHAQQFLARMQVAEDADFLKRVEFAAIKTAIAVAAEDQNTCCYPAGVTHSTATDEQRATARAVARARTQFASSVLRNSASEARQIAKAVVTNLALTAQSTDADVEFTVISMWNAFARPGGTIP